MQVRNPSVVLTHETNGISTAVGMVACVQAKRDHARVCIGQEAFDLILVFDVGFGMRMEHSRQSESLPHQTCKLVDGFHEPLPGILVESRGGYRFACEQVCIGVIYEQVKSCS